jgi:tripartite-type tricarboxylate transporter receptor subunit TctC
VTIVVPAPPGGGTDVLTRAVGQELSRMWGQPVVVDNAGGADGMIAARKVMAAKPDGHTYLMFISAITLAKHLPSANGTDPLTQLVPVSAYANLSGVAVANAKLPGKTLPEMVAYCKSAAQPCSLGTAEPVSRLLAREFAEETGLKNLVIVNYKGGSQMITDVVSGNVSMAFLGLTPAMPFYKSGGVKVLAALGGRRSSVLPDVPTAQESGYPRLVADTWYALFALKGTPKNVVEATAAAVAQAVKGETASRTFATMGAEPVGSTPEKFEAAVRADSRRMDELVQRFPLAE